MIPCHFGIPESPLFGVYHEPVTRPRSSAVLLCYPIGHEYTNAHGAFRDLASALAAEGFPVLRFDYWGSGDSSGGQIEATLEKWDESVDLAAAELKDMSGMSAVSVVGLRFGAVLASRFSRRATVRHLVLWDPVATGADYLSGLRTLHNARLARKRGTSIRAAAATEDSVELAGYLYPDALRDAIGTIRLCDTCRAVDESLPAPQRTVVVCGKDLPVCRALEGCLPGNVERHVVEDSSPWALPSRWGEPFRARAIPGWIVAWFKENA